MDRTVRGSARKWVGLSFFFSLIPMAGCSVFLPSPKPLPAAIEVRGAQGIEQHAMESVRNSGINADVVHARIVRVLDEGALARKLDVVVVVRSRAMDDLCTWGAYRYRQGPYGLTREGGPYDRGRIACSDLSGH